MLDDLTISQMTVDDAAPISIDPTGKVSPTTGFTAGTQFVGRDDITQFCLQTSTYPVVDKLGDGYVLVKAFSELAEAREFIQGTKFLIWYVSEFP